MEDYRQPKPEWLKVRLRRDGQYRSTEALLRAQQLHTICTSGKCPNIKECWAAGTATFMILGEICTRACRFCNTHTGRPLPPDPGEPGRVAKAVSELGLKHVVVTSVDRDDLPDFGAAHWAATVEAIRAIRPEAAIEVLIPDFQGRHDCLDTLIQTRPAIIGHNLETVRRLTPAIRSRANYATSLEVIRYVAASGIPAKSGIMLGLGETHEEILETMDDLIAAGCSLLTIGQYLRPTPSHHPVAKYLDPEYFGRLHDIALQKGFRAAECGPLVRSSYHASVQAQSLKP